MGADRPTGLLEYAMQGSVFQAAGAMWLSWRRCVVEYVAMHQGSATMLPRRSERYDWASAALYYKPMSVRLCTLIRSVLIRAKMPDITLEGSCGKGFTRESGARRPSECGKGRAAP
jgi:hypothetical protein